MNLKKNPEKSTSQDFKTPKWLQGPVPSGRPETELDSMIEEAQDDPDYQLDARVFAKPHPSERWKAYKKVKRRITEMEEMHEWIRKKADEDETEPNRFLDRLEKVLNSLVS